MIIKTSESDYRKLLKCFGLVLIMDLYQSLKKGCSYVSGLFKKSAAKIEDMLPYVTIQVDVPWREMKQVRQLVDKGCFPNAGAVFTYVAKLYVAELERRSEDLAHGLSISLLDEPEVLTLAEKNRVRKLLGLDSLERKVG